MTAISDYFRTALLIDDQVEESTTTPLEDLSSEQSEGISEEPEPGLTPPPENRKVPIYSSELVRSFLDKGVVCSVYEVRETDTEEESRLNDLILHGAGIADLLILDWLLFGDDSDTVKAIKTITEEHEDRLTIIVVFTGTPSLISIVERLEEAAGFNRVDDENFVLKRDHTVVLVFGKPKTQLHDSTEKNRIATYQNLPGKIQTDLTKVFRGRMSEFAFKGVNVIRESVPRVLATFSSSLDIGALIHRALLPEPDDAGSQLIRLLASDFEQALTEQRVDDVWNTDSVRQFLLDSHLIVSPDKLAQYLKDNGNVEADLKKLDGKPLANEAVAMGLSRIGMSSISSKTAKRLTNLLTCAFGKDLEQPKEAEKSNETFAALMSSIDFGNVPPVLELGVVLKVIKALKDDEPSVDFWLCIQPLCDSVRIRDRRAFPLMPLKKSCEGGEESDAMIRDGDDFIAVPFQKHPYELKMSEFKPEKENGRVIATGESSNWQFEDVDGRIYRAVTRLRFELAAKAVQGFASSASRVGVDVSEWLRRRAPEPSKPKTV